MAQLYSMIQPRTSFQQAVTHVTSGKVHCEIRVDVSLKRNVRSSIPKESVVGLTLKVHKKVPRHAWTVVNGLGSVGIGTEVGKGSIRKGP